MLFAEDLSNSNRFVNNITYPGLRIVGYSSTYHVFLLGLLVCESLLMRGILVTRFRRNHFIMC